jgi:hypothetical protein
MPLQETILEFDREKLAERIQEVETIIFERLQAISQTDDKDERQALSDATSLKRVLKKDKLS